MLRNTKKSLHPKIMQQYFSRQKNPSKYSSFTNNYYKIS